MDTTISTLIAAADSGDANAAQALFAALYADLHRLARRELARHGGGGAIGVTTLLHEAYLDIAARDGAAFPDRARFMTYAARVMRGVIVDHARRNQATKRGGEFTITSLALDGSEPAAGGAQVADSAQIVALADALAGLADLEPALAEIVDLKFFCGFSFGDIATLQGTSERTVQRQWRKARLYLHQVLRSSQIL
jgi:RNA polymerase sigma factor (TIGR02999 family)